MKAVLGLFLAFTFAPLGAEAQVFRSENKVSQQSASESFQNGDITLAIQKWSKEIRAGENIELALFHRAQAYIVLSQYEFASIDINKLLSLQGEAPTQEALVVKGIVMTALNQLDEAILSFNKAEKLKPSTLVYSNRALAYQRAGKLRHAIADFQKALTVEPTLLNQINLSNAKIQAGDIETAVQEMSEIITHNPKFYPAYLSRGIAYYHQDDHELAIRDFIYSLNLGPAQAQAYYYAGLSLVELDHTQEAIDNLTHAADLYLQQGHPHLYHAILEKMDDLNLGGV